MLRVVGQAGDASIAASTRIENRIGESAANPYLYIASQIHAGLDGIDRQLKAPPASSTPYDQQHAKLPTSMSEAIEALKADAQLTKGDGEGRGCGLQP